MADSTQHAAMTSPHFDHSVTDQSSHSSAKAPAVNNTPWKRPTPVTKLNEATLGRVSEILVLDSQCSVLVYKRSLQNIPLRKSHQLFLKHMKTVGEKSLNPYFRDDNIDLFYLRRNDIFIVATCPSPDTDSAITPLVFIEFLERIFSIIQDCVGTVNEARVSVNKMLIFEVLDEIMNFGYGFTSTYAEIKPYLSCEPVKPRHTEQSELASRIFGINAADKSRLQTSVTKTKDKAQNSAYINIMEELSAVLACDGQVHSCELCGRLSLISTLERPSPISIQLNEDLVIRHTGQPKVQVGGATHIENPSFHACVDTSHLDKTRMLRVMPPPDQTCLMTYTSCDSACIRIPIVLLPTLSCIEGSRDQDLTLRLINQAESFAVASCVKVSVKLPVWIQSISTTKTKQDHTSCFKQEESSVEWEIKKFRGGMEEFIHFRLICPSNKSVRLSEVGPLSVAFTLTHFSASGLVVRTAWVEHNNRHQQGQGVQQGIQAPGCFFGVSTKTASYTVRTETS